jgi:hypothetical protein
LQMQDLAKNDGPLSFWPCQLTFLPLKKWKKLDTKGIGVKLTYVLISG